MSTLERSDAGEGWAHGRIGNVVFLCYETSVPEEAVELSFGFIDRSIEKHPGGIALVAMFGERSPVPSAQARQRIASHLKRHAEQLLIGCTVIEGESMSSMVKRVATTMVTTLVKPVYPHRILRSAGAACDYVARKAVGDSGTALAQGTLFAAVTALRPYCSPVEHEAQ